MIHDHGRLLDTRRDLVGQGVVEVVFVKPLSGVVGALCPGLVPDNEQDLYASLTRKKAAEATPKTRLKLTGKDQSGSSK